MSQVTKKTGKNSGMAMLIMLLLVPIILGLSMSFVDPIIRSYRASVNDQKTLLAKTIADSMFEIALWESRGAGTGANTAGCIGDCITGIDFGFGTATGTWEVQGTPPIDADNLINGEYTIPAPGTGNAGGDYCSGANPVVDDIKLEEALDNLEIPIGDLGGFYEVLDWPCHWNKLREGESVSIPMYVEDEDGYDGPLALGLTDFQLRIRPACNPSAITGRSDAYKQQICQGVERYELDDVNGALLEETVIVLWEISGKDTNENGEQIVLGPNPNALIFFNTYFDVKVINSYKTTTTFIPPQVYPLNMDTDTINNNGDINDLFTNLTNIYKPHLNLLGIYTLKDKANLNTIPYLEYQFKAPISIGSQKPIASTTKVVKVDVMINGGYSETLEKTIEIPKSISGFVIQQL